MTEKYGFVYIWFDKKHKRYYIGCHWGTENDGYICSSTWMKNAYKRRPNDFKRRILKTNITNRRDLLSEEYYWLKQIKPSELKTRYYNNHNHHFNHWSTDEKKSAMIIEKNSKTNKGRIPWNKGKKGQYTEQQLEKMGKAKPSVEARQKMSDAKKGTVSPFKGKRRDYSEQARKGMGHWKNKKQPRTVVEARMKGLANHRWVTNGVVDKRMTEDQLKNNPDFTYGRTNNCPPKHWIK